jgi:tetratricopeptide (TPR) repeat protein
MRRLLPALLPALLSVSLSALVPGAVSAAGSTTANKIKQAAALSRKGGRALAAGDRARAAEAFEKALLALPTFPDAHLGMGHMAMAEKDYEAALESYRRARDGYVALGSDLDALKLENYAETQKRVAELRDQMSNLGRATTNARTDARTEAELQRKLTIIQDQIRRLEAVEPPRPSASDPVPAEVLFFIGNAQFYLQRYDEARVSWETCAKRNPGFAQIHNNLAVIYWKAGRFPDAQRELAEAERLGFPVNPKMKEDLAKDAASAASGS